MTGLKIAGVVLGLAILIGLILDQAKPAFDPVVLRGIAGQVQQLSSDQVSQGKAPLSLNQTMEEIQKLLHEKYPDHIYGIDSDRWTSNLAGGFKTGMLIMHGSLTEYIMFWGASLPTTGHSGRNWAEFHDYILSGEGKWWKEGGLSVHSYHAGDYVFTSRFSGGIVHLTEGTWMLEYCRGVIPALLPFGLADSIFSSLDPVTVYRSLTIYGEMVIKELLFNFKL